MEKSVVSMRGVSRLVGLGAKTAAWVSAAAVHEAMVPEAERGAVFQRYMKRWAASLVSSSGGRISLAPGSSIPVQRGPRVVVSNHRSPFDIGVLLSLFGGHALSRKDLENWPVLGLAARRAGTIFVDREDAGSGAQAIRAIRRRLAEGASILIFPEGGTFVGDTVRPFKAGAFAALRGLDVDIVPVGLAYDDGAEWDNEGFVEHVLRVAGRPVTRCAVSVGPVMKAEGRSQHLAERVHGHVQAQVETARGHHRTLV
jgi:1-acyl-sn-glycerol-3-phosphate acyltransferase